MDYHAILNKAIAEAKKLYAEVSLYGSPAHIYQELEELLDFYIHQYTTIITNISAFKQQVENSLHE